MRTNSSISKFAPSSVLGQTSLEELRSRSASSAPTSPKDCSSFVIRGSVTDGSEWKYGANNLLENTQRSQSNNSNISVASTSSRSGQQLQSQIQYAARPTTPQKEDNLVISHQNSISSAINSGQSNEVTKDRTTILKIPYQRPKHKRVYCNNCDEHLDGFRGEDNLCRHQDLHHKLGIRKFICVQPNRSQDDL